MSGSPGSHYAKTGAVMKAFFKVSNEVRQESEKVHCEGDAADKATIIDYSKTGANKR